jgi:hypothetical protein
MDGSPPLSNSRSPRVKMKVFSETLIKYKISTTQTYLKTKK